MVDETITERAAIRDSDEPSERGDFPYYDLGPATSETVGALDLDAEVRSLRVKVAAVEAQRDEWAAKWKKRGVRLHEMRKALAAAEAESAYHLSLIDGETVLALVKSRAALATGEGQHVAREVFTAEGIPFVRCSCSTAINPQSAVWLTEHIPNGGVAELQAVVKRQAEGAKA